MDKLRANLTDPNLGCGSCNSNGEEGGKSRQMICTSYFQPNMTQIEATPIPDEERREMGHNSSYSDSAV